MKKIFSRLSLGFSLVELMISISILATLFGIITINLNTAHVQASLSTTVDTLVADLSQQQIKAMVGDTEGRSNVDNYGVHFDTTKYTLFHGTYSTSEQTNFSVDAPDIFQITTTFPNSEVVFEKGSGEIVGFNSSKNTITVTNTASSVQKIIEMNKYGVVIAIN